LIIISEVLFCVCVPFTFLKDHLQKIHTQIIRSQAASISADHSSAISLDFWVSSFGLTFFGHFCLRFDVSQSLFCGIWEQYTSTIQYTIAAHTRSSWRLSHDKWITISGYQVVLTSVEPNNHNVIWFLTHIRKKYPHLYY